MAEVFLSAEIPDFRADIRQATERVKEAAGGQLDDWVDRSRHAVQRGRKVAEDLADDCTHTVRKYPLSSVTGGMVVGFVLGGLIGWLLGRRR